MTRGRTYGFWSSQYGYGLFCCGVVSFRTGTQSSRPCNAYRSVLGYCHWPCNCFF